MDKVKAIILDIDGTIALNLSGRNMFDYAKVVNDSLNQPVYELAHGMFLKGYELLFVSGREDVCRTETADWLKQKLPWYADQIDGKLFMRRARDFRDDTIVKEEIYRSNIEPFYDVQFVVDDRQKVVQMWRKIGLTCLQCAPGDFDTKWMCAQAESLLCDNGYHVVGPLKLTRVTP